jgi:hypothetical protein
MSGAAALDEERISGEAAVRAARSKILVFIAVY